MTRELSRVCWLRRDQHNRQHMQSQEGEKSLSRAEHAPRRLSQKVSRNSVNSDPSQNPPPPLGDWGNFFWAFWPTKSFFRCIKRRSISGKIFLRHQSKLRASGGVGVQAGDGAWAQAVDPARKPGAIVSSGAVFWELSSEALLKGLHPLVGAVCFQLPPTVLR